MKKALLVTAAAVSAMLAPAVAHAETPPGCASAQQIGSTAHVKFGNGKVIGRVNQREVWSKSTDTVNRCTRALGRVALGEDGWSAYSSKRC